MQKKLSQINFTIWLTRVLLGLVVGLALTAGYTGSKLSLEQRKYHNLKTKYDALQKAVSATPAATNL